MIELLRHLRAKHPPFLAVNTALGNIKTSLSGTYHVFGFRKYAHRYLGQVQYLFNRRSTCASSGTLGSGGLSGSALPASHRVLLQ